MHIHKMYIHIMFFKNVLHRDEGWTKSEPVVSLLSPKVSQSEQFLLPLQKHIKVRGDMQKMQETPG